MPLLHDPAVPHDPARVIPRTEAQKASDRSGPPPEIPCVWTIRATEGERGAWLREQKLDGYSFVDVDDAYDVIGERAEQTGKYFRRGVSADTVFHVVEIVDGVEQKIEVGRIIGEPR